MHSLWNDAEAASFTGELGLRAYTSRLLGREPALVLHGGGNTSVKVRSPGAPEVLYVKGTGSDLARVDETAFTPLFLQKTLDLFDRAGLDNGEMMRLLGERLARRPAPKPSIETMLHAALPLKYVEHTHADSVLAVANVENGERVVADLYGELAPSVPYYHSGVALARACRDTFLRCGTKRTIGLILRFHGVVAFGDTARESYENMLRLVTLAEDYLKAQGAWQLPVAGAAAGTVRPEDLAALQARISHCAGVPLVLQCHRDPACLAYVRRADLQEIALQGPPTPQHAIYTKRIPQLGRDVETYAGQYRKYLERALGPAHAAIDAAPRIVLDPELGVCALGLDPGQAAIAGEIYRHDIEIITRASGHSRYRSASEQAIAIAELEYGAGITHGRA